MEIDNFIEIPLILGFVFFFLGIIMYFFPSKKINSFYGYRTSTSMKNEENWNFAQKYSSIKMVQSSLFLLLISCLGFFISFQESNQKVIGFIALAIVIVFMFFSTEKAMRRKFPNT